MHSKLKCRVEWYARRIDIPETAMVASRTDSGALRGSPGNGVGVKSCLTTFVLVVAMAWLTAGCEKKESYSNVDSNGEVETPSAPVDKTENIPPHKRFKNVQEACPPLPVKDGFVTVKMKVLQKDGGLEKGAGGSLKFDGEITLRLPEYARIGRRPAMYGECEYAQRVDIPYTWYKGKLIPGQGARFDIPSDYDRRVDVIAQEGGIRHAIDERPTEPWRFMPTIPHKFLPLEFYPRYRWETEAGPQFRSSESGAWSIVNTKHKGPDGKTFTAGWCTIEIAGLSQEQPIQPIAVGMADDGDSKCNGAVRFERNGTIMAFAIRNWKDTVPEINHIYDAVYEEVQHFIQ